ncbi:unnamed protein product [Timema podura]|uniref:Uncharacterized protein n=1 Tax=Timema podura TaxID=61482 RepID=A0ABN7PG84_TIMPD|nr:unnamed protein product [Timema podura]
MFTFQMPITLLLAHALDRRLRNHGLEKPCTMLGFVWQHALFVVLIGLQMMFAYFFWLAYGTMAFLLGPLRSWSIVLAVVLWHQANTLPEYCLR